MKEEINGWMNGRIDVWTMYERWMDNDMLLYAVIEIERIVFCGIFLIN